MIIQDAKQIKLADYLQSLGYTPIKQQGKSLWYKSPLDTEIIGPIQIGLNKPIHFIDFESSVRV